jgi:beta-glucosidase/6-phospho-beta-glucosidase/beta-galactosidase
MDSFRRGESHSQRLGLVSVDCPTQRRTIKKCGYWHRDLIVANRLEH